MRDQVAPLHGCNPALQQCFYEAGAELRDAARESGRAPRSKKLTAEKRKKRIAAREAWVDKQPWLVHKRPGPVVTWNVDYSRMRKCIGYLTSTVSPSTAADCGVEVAYDEGCEVCTITRDALARHYDDWAAGHPAFCARKDIGPPRSLYLQKPVKLNNFHDTSAEAPLMVHIHLRLQHAVYPVKRNVVDLTPFPIVLGLPFRRRYDVPLPHGFKPSTGKQGMGVAYVGLGVLVGYGVSLPPGLSKRAAQADPASLACKQVLSVTLSWQNWRQTGKELSPTALRPILGLPKTTQ